MRCSKPFSQILPKERQKVCVTCGIQCLQVLNTSYSCQITPYKVESGRDKNNYSSLIIIQNPQPGDAYVELECAVASGGATLVRRDDERDLQFAAARRVWDAYEPGRNIRGSEIR